MAVWTFSFLRVWKGASWLLSASQFHVRNQEKAHRRRPISLAEWKRPFSCYYYFLKNKKKKKVGNVTIVSESFDSIRHFFWFFFCCVFIFVFCSHFLVSLHSVKKLKRGKKKRNSFDTRLGKERIVFHLFASGFTTPFPLLYDCCSIIYTTNGSFFKWFYSP